VDVRTVWPAGTDVIVAAIVLTCSSSAGAKHNGRGSDQRGDE
jgi:hypothetical protein